MAKQSFTSASANKLLKKLADDRAMLLSQEAEDCTYKCFKDEDPEIPEYDYEETTKQIEEIYEKERKIRHAIHQFNMTATLEGTNTTVDEALIMLAQMSRKYARLERLRIKKPVTRLGAAYLKSSVEFEYANFNVKQTRKDCKKLESEIFDLQLKIDNCNQTKSFEIDL